LDRLKSAAALVAGKYGLKQLMTSEDSATQQDDIRIYSMLADKVPGKDF
jgi:hypothetical protein